VVMGRLCALRSRLTSSVSRGRSWLSNFASTSLRVVLLRYSRSARPHARMQVSCRFARHVEKWLYPLTGCIHLVSSCLLVLIEASSDRT
jgi:hypothetical protein